MTLRLQYSKLRFYLHLQKRLDTKQLCITNANDIIIVWVLMIIITNDSSVEHMRAHTGVQSRSTPSNFNQLSNYELIKIC